MVIDSHQHFWQRNLPFDYSWQDADAFAPIRRDFLPVDLEPHLRQSGVDRTILVQTQHNIAENHWGLELANRHDFIAGVVGWIDLASEQCEAQLMRFKDQPKFVGIRHVTQDEPDDNFIIRPEVLRGLKVLERHDVPFDLLFFVKHLKHAATLARLLPNLRMVIDHLAKPNIREGKTAGWIEPLREAARFPNVYCKLSGMVTEADWRSWKAADLKPYVEVAIDLFGPRRCMFGSDWPVCELAGSYQQVHNALSESVSRLGASAQQAIFGETAREFYRIDAR